MTTGFEMRKPPSGVVARWKWCEKCPNLKTSVKKEGDGVLMGFDHCECIYEGGYIFPGMEGKNLKESCLHYADAMVEQLNHES